MIKWLISLFKSPPIPVQADNPSPETPKGRTGFFSTDLPSRERRPYSEHQELLALTFQRSIGDVAIAADASESAIAQDSSVKAAFLSRTSGVPEEQIAWYASQGFIGYQFCATLAQQWLVDKACSMPGEDAVRNGWTFDFEAQENLDSKKVTKHLRKADKRFKIRKGLEEFSRSARIFGIRHAMAVIESTDKDFYEKPFNADGITSGSYRGMTQIDPYWITPELDAAAAADPASLHFYEPTFWRVGGKRIHRSHLIICIPEEVPDILKPTYMYGGVPLTQRIYERVYAAERCANEGPQLLLTKRATVIHTDVEKVMMDQGKFEQRMGDWIYYRDNFGVKILGKEEVMEQFDTSLTDTDAVIMTQYQLVAAIAKVPATKLLGTSPKGFGASGDYENASYHEHLESIQVHDLEPFLDRHNLCVMRSEIASRFGVKPFEVDVSWESVDAPTAKEIAEINLIKAQTGQALVDAGAIDGMDERARIKEDLDSGYTGLADVEDEDTDGGDITSSITIPGVSELLNLG